MPARQPPPEARLIASARAALVPSVSMREAASRAGISPTRWRQLEAGVIRVRGKDYRETAPAETLARMALAVGVTPEEVTAAGREDAAVLMGALQRDGHVVLDPAEQQIRGMDWLSREEQDELITQYRQRSHARRHAG